MSQQFDEADSNAVRPRETTTSPALSAPYQGRSNNYERRGPRAAPQVTGEPEEVTVKWFNVDKGFGFLTDKSGKDLFVHISTVRLAGMSNLAPEQKLTIRRGPGRKDGEAANQIIGPAA